MLLALGLALGSLPPATAADVSIHGRIGIPAPVAGGAVDLHMAREDLELQYDDGPDGAALETRRLGLSYYEPLGRGLLGGFRAGAIEATQSGRDATRDVDPDGHYLELDLRAAAAARGRLRAGIGASWRYAVVDGTDGDGNETRIEWQALELRPAIRLGLSERLAAHLGLSLTALAGDERQRGPTAGESSGFDADGAFGATAALAFHPGRGDTVILRLRGGQGAGAYIGFEHRY